MSYVTACHQDSLFGVAIAIANGTNFATSRTPDASFFLACGPLSLAETPWKCVLPQACDGDAPCGPTALPRMVLFDSAVTGTFWMVAWHHLAALFESPVQRIGISGCFMEDLCAKG
jgi:hypothetical protein